MARKAKRKPAPKKRQKLKSPAFDYKALGFKEARWRTTRGLGQDTSHDYELRDEWGVGAILVYDTPPKGPHAWRHFVTRSVKPVTLVWDGSKDKGSCWLLLGRDPAIERRLKRAKFLHIET